MTYDTPLSPRPLHHLADGRRLLTASQLRAHGVPAAETAERCRPGGPWSWLLPGVVLLHPGPPTAEERLRAVLLYAARERTSDGAPGVPAQPPSAGAAPVYTEAVITGAAALTLHGFAGTPPAAALERVDVLVPLLRRLRSAGWARVVRTAALPTAERIDGLPVAPVARALADAVAGPSDAGTVRGLLTEAVRDGHCEAAAVVRELSRARLLDRPHVVDAVESLVAEGRATAEDRLYRTVREHRLPDPVWDVVLRLPGGPLVGGADAFWPEQGVAVVLDPGGARGGDGTPGGERARERERLEGLGVIVVRISPRGLRDRPEDQAAVVRTALMAAGDREPAEHLVVLPR
ncbi:hypothetical protein AB0M23_26965 [Streptomyces sp. NPDC052077]|uniref:hypothetical protein n=1 Tax=Streptomyces sp. NPDC052077 TaxID=3154757 RepID=UPI00342C6F81